MRRTSQHNHTPEGVRSFRLQLAVLIVVYTLAVYSGIFALTRALVLDSLRAEGSSYFALVVDMRDWNAAHGAVWVPKDADTPSNPFLEEIGITPDIRTETGATLTMRNPSAMTREVSELARQRSGVSFHLMADDYLNPSNAPDTWEEQALRAFEAGAQTRFGIDEIAGERFYRYAAPLVIDETCLGCHRQQGYAVGEVRGGMTVSIPMDDTDVMLRRAAYFFGGMAILTLTGALFTLRLLGERMESRVTAANERLLEIATTDGLTGVLNRSAALARLQEEFDRSKRTEVALSILMLDLDHFKRVNDTFGHATGDCVLQRFAARVAESLRTYDAFGRIGGEEFLVIAPGTDDVTACELAERVRTTVGDPPIDCDTAIALTVSTGVATVSAQDAGIDSLLQRADDAMYAAKRAGRDCVRCSKSDNDDTGTN